MPNDDFIDFYELMQISFSAEHETVQRVYRMLATRYHPDNPRTGDPDRFIRLRQAYETLSDPRARATYDLQ
jgi:DnaJ-class molecular chaperone